MRLRHRRLLRREHRLSGVDRNLGGVEIALRQELSRTELLRARVLLLRVGELDFGALEVALCLGQVGARLRQVGARLLQLRVEHRRLEPRDDLALLDDRVEVGAEPADVARHLAADHDGRDGLERPGRSHRIDDIAARRRCGVHLQLGAAAAHVVRPDTRPDGGDE